jgi:cytochrome c biogenesis protein CcmG, thiol:disulfide interchange protein DsbE
VRTVRILLWLPLIGFLIVLGLVASGLIAPHDATIRSHMTGKPMPAFTLPRAGGGAPVTQAVLADGRPKLINLFASWCVPCIAEAPQLMALKAKGVEIVGIDIRDEPKDLAAFLARNGNPYALIARDDASALQVALGSSGVPESFVVDGKGVIRLQHIGDIRPEQVDEIAAAVQGAR